MEFCHCTLHHLIDTLNGHKESFSSLSELFQQAESLTDLKISKANSKFGVFSPLFILCQMLDGLSFIHDSCGIVHRDIKPQNIFLVEDGNIKIGDFGLSKDLNKETGAGPLYAVGTRFYMAPEFLTEGETSGGFLPSADMFSLGMVMVRLLTAVSMAESEQLRLNDRLRRDCRRGLAALLRDEAVVVAAAGTTKGNLLAARAAHLPLLLSFFRSLLGSLLERRPAARLTARLARQQATLIFEQIFSANQFFRPKIGSK